MRSTPRNLIICILTLVLASVCAAEEYFQTINLAPDLLLIYTDQGSYSNNSLVFTGDDGLLLVDTHHDTDQEEFKKFVDGLGFGDPKYIICTHRHVEHIGGNALFGPDPIIISHSLLPQKLKRGSFVFNEYPADALPDITFADSMEIRFNGETIRLANIGGSHDDNEIMVHFTNHGVAHISSMVNGFNFPSVDSDGDVLQFEPQVRRLMTLLPQDIKLISGHHGKVGGYDFVGKWDQLPAYADMMKSTIDIVSRGLAAGKTQEEMQEAGVLDDYAHYGGSYVSASDWIEYIVDVMTVPREIRDDICPPVFEVWKKDGAAAAVNYYKELFHSQEEQYDFNEYILMSIGSKLYSRGLYEDSLEFIRGCIEIYPEAEYTFYNHYLLARGLNKLGKTDEAIKHCKESLKLNAEFGGATTLLAELEE